MTDPAMGAGLGASALLPAPRPAVVIPQAFRPEQVQAGPLAGSIPEPAKRADPLAVFGVAVSFDATQAVLGVRGEVDLISAPELAAVLDAVIDRGHRSVVLDLSALTFMDAAGLGVIADAVRRLRHQGGVVTIRCPSAMVRRLLDITKLAQVVHLELSRPARGGMDSEQSVKFIGAQS